MLVVAEHGLVGDAVGAALRAAGLRVLSRPWEAYDGVPRGLAGHDAGGLLLTDLGNTRSVAAARRRLDASVPDRFDWVVLTGAPRGPSWGAVLAAGARDVLPARTSLEEVQRALDLPRPEPWVGDEERSELVDAWTRLSRDSEERAERLRTLSPREHQVLDLLYRGQSVRRIARSSGVATSTVRSQVKSVLGKLGVSSQLAAVAVYDHDLSTRSPSMG